MPTVPLNRPFNSPQIFTVNLSANYVYGNATETVFTDGSNIVGNGRNTLSLNYLNGVYVSSPIYASSTIYYNGITSDNWNTAYQLLTGTGGLTNYVKINSGPALSALYINTSPYTAIINNDGSGKLSNGVIYWDTAGVFTAGTVVANGGNSTQWNQAYLAISPGGTSSNWNAAYSFLTGGGSVNGNVSINGNVSVNNTLSAYYIVGNSSETVFTDGSNPLGFGDKTLTFNYLNGVYSSSNFYPATDGNYDLGSSVNKWKNIYATNGTIQTSDQRDKTDISESSLGLEFINKLKPVSYKFISGKRTHFGLIAQEVKQNIPDGTDFGGWVLGDINDKNSPQGLRYDEFIAPMIKAIQELTTTVKSLSTQNQILVTLVNRLTSNK